MASTEQMNYGVYQRYQALYDPMLHKTEREEKIFDAELKKSIVNSADGPINVIINDISK